MAAVSNLSERELAIASAVARAAIPGGERVHEGGKASAERLAVWLAQVNPGYARAFKSLLWTIELGSAVRTGHVFSKLNSDRASKLLEGAIESGLFAERTAMRALVSAVKATHFDEKGAFERLGCPSFHDRLPMAESPKPWESKIIDGKLAGEDIELECDVVVVGSGAGGAACAYELALRGHAVLLVEEGSWVRRHELSGRSLAMLRRLYRDQGMTVAFGSLPIPIPAGRAVGGSTIVNNGTCYRAPERIFKRWRDQYGLYEFSSESMQPYYERVEQMIHVEPAPMALTGGIGRVIARGSERLGLRHGPVRRNAPGCDGQGTCCFGCPSGAKRSTDVSYVPEALKRGAELITDANVFAIDLEQGKARGIRARLRSGKKLTVRAQAVVIAGGALMTPVLLRKAGVCPETDAIGRFLTIHPTTKAMALFNETIDMARAIPQGYAIEHFNDEGIMFEGGSIPLDITAIAIPWVGPKFTELVDRFRELAIFGFMIEDSSHGSVRPGPFGKPLITYSLTTRDLERIRQGLRTLCEVYKAAGAERIFPFVRGFDEVRSQADIERFARHRFSPRDFEISAYHPLGTCRMGTDPDESAIGPDHETHEVERLYVVDGSAIPTPLGVNPQLTIMALAVRAAEIIDRRLS